MGKTEEKLEPVVFVESHKKPAKVEVDVKKDTRPKRGQKAKLKKMKEKYKDQDGEDRELAMQLLQKTSKEDSKKNRKKMERKEAQDRKTKNRELNKQWMAKNAAKSQQRNDPDSDGDEATTVKFDVDVLNSLTGQPVAEDALLFAVPVVAPYSTMNNYRYKVKVTPGSSKRGKAAKTALNIFINDKSAVQRDKDLLKSVKDQDIARNLPGKVKVSTLVKK